MAGGNRRSGSPGALQITGYNRLERFAGQPLGQGGRLALADGIERHVVLALEALGGIPVGKTVADE
jgi:hypothetical protein